MYSCNNFNGNKLSSYYYNTTIVVYFLPTQCVDVIFTGILYIVQGERPNFLVRSSYMLVKPNESKGGLNTLAIKISLFLMHILLTC